jgi:signal transduction histidine kinase
MPETLLDELKRYVGFGSADEAALRSLHPVAQPHFERIAVLFYDRILEHEGARQALVGGESAVGRLKVKLVEWMDRLLTGPWDDDYFEARCRIGRVHVRIKLPQHYMFGAMNVLRGELKEIIDSHYDAPPSVLRAARTAVGKALDIELAIMLHTYREDLLEQQARIERLSVFGQLVGSIGHELRNPLGVIETSLFLVRQRIGTDEKARKHVDRIGEQLNTANQIVTDLLDIIRDRPLLRESVRLEAVVQAALAMVHLPADVKVVTNGLSELPEFRGDASQLRQVFVNLIDNGVHAASPTGQVTVSGTSNDMIEITIQDTGAGIDPSIQRRLFEPLVTTKPKGIGLGLSLVKRIVERHQGTIACTSTSGEGARFVIRLPRG